MNFEDDLFKLQTNVLFPKGDVTVKVKSDNGSDAIFVPDIDTLVAAYVKVEPV
jgi:hypothetical protein